MAERLFIVTGSSRGMGHAMVEQLLGAGTLVIGIARQASDGLRRLAESRGARLEQWQLDLAQPEAAAARLQAWLGEQHAGGFEAATLINNAALLNRVGPVEACDPAELASALRVSLEAPMLLTAAFLSATRGWPGARRVLNISSGLGRRAMAGSAGYCAAKAGLDHFTRAVALDEARHAHGARLVALAPGVIDTDMQLQLRSSAPEGFPDLGNFVALKDGGQLASATDAAARVLAYLQRADFGTQPVVDIRDPA